MEDQAVTARESAGTPRGHKRLANLAIMGITAVVIGAVAVLANQPPSGVNAITTTGAVTGDPPEVGKPAPDFLARTIDGKSIRISELKGQAVWLTFGATWCQPCRAENPDIQATYEKFGAQGLVVVAVYIGEDDKTVLDYTDRVRLTYPRIADSLTQIASQYRILGIPSHFFIDRTGIMREMRIGAMDLAAMEASVKKILG
jgi:Peroxiredoxin